MNSTDLQLWIEQNPVVAISTMITICIVLFLFTRNFIARGLIHLAGRTQSKVDDILVKHLQPVRIAWIAPFALLYAFAYLLPDYQEPIRKISLFVVLWVAVVTISSLLNAINEIYESRPTFNGISIQSYLDIAKIIAFLVAVILSISIFSDESPAVLLTGLGALTAVLLLIFQDTILSIVASVQISTHDLIKEGDWIDVPSYGASGKVVNMSLHTIKIQNLDRTFTVIPTVKMVEVAYKNWRGMQESGGRRAQRSLLVDMNTIKFCDEDLLHRLLKIDLIQDEVNKKINALQDFRRSSLDTFDSPLDGPQITNTEIYRIYIEKYLGKRTDIDQMDGSLLAHALAPSPAGLPIEVVYTAKTIAFDVYTRTQSEIFDHLLAAAPHFELRVFQEPTGLDFSTFAQNSLTKSSLPVRE